MSKKVKSNMFEIVDQKYLCLCAKQLIYLTQLLRYEKIC